MTDHRSYTTEDGALGPMWDAETEQVGEVVIGRMTRLMTLLRAVSAPADGLPDWDAMREVVDLVLDGRHAPATREELGALIDLMRRYLDQLVRAAEAPGGGPMLGELAEKGLRLLTDRAADSPQPDVALLAGAVQDLMAAVEPGGGS